MAGDGPLERVERDPEDVQPAPESGEGEVADVLGAGAEGVPVGAIAVGWRQCLGYCGKEAERLSHGVGKLAVVADGLAEVPDPVLGTRRTASGLRRGLLEDPPRRAAPHRPADADTHRLLGCQIAGHRDGQVAKRIDIAATAIFAELTIDQISDLDLSYSPPFGSPWDALQAGAQTLSRKKSGIALRRRVRR